MSEQPLKAPVESGRVTDATAAHWAQWAKTDVPAEYPLWRVRAACLLADRDRWIALATDTLDCELCILCAGHWAEARKLLKEAHDA